MSASRERKKRIEQPEVAAPQKNTTKKKLSEGMIFAIVTLSIVAILICGVVGYRHLATNGTVMQIGDTKVTVTDFNYYCRSIVETVGNESYASILGIDPTKSLDDQYVSQDAMMYMGLFGLNTEVLQDHEPKDGVVEVTWAEVVAANAKLAAINSIVIYNEAMAANYQMEDHAKEEIENAVETMRGYAEGNRESLDNLLERYYGKGCDEESYRKYLTIQTIASHYPEGLKYSQDEIAARFEETPETFTVASFYIQTVTASQFVEVAADGSTPEVDDTHKEKASAEAKRLEKELDTAAEDVSLKVDQTRAAITSQYTEDMATWMFDTAKKDDVKSFEKDDSTFYVVKKIDASNDYATLNLLQIAIAADGETPVVDGKTAEEKVAAIDAALEDGTDTDEFMELVELYGSEHGAEINGATYNTFSSISDDAVLWAMGEHTDGELKKFEKDGTTYFFFVVGTGESYKDEVVNATLAREHITELAENAEATCGYNEAAALRAKYSYR